MATLYKETVTRTKGDDWNVDLTITATDALGTETAVTGLSTATITATIKLRDTGAQVWQGTRAGGQITVTSDPNGQISIAVPAATTATLSQRLYNMDVQYVKNSVTVTPKRWYVQVVEDYT
jgi:hypothetical protein